MDLLGIFARTLLSLTPISQSAAVPPATPVVAPAPTAKLSADGAIDQVQKFYAGIQQVSAVFRQSVTYETFGTTKTSDGSLYIQKPGKMRWDYKTKKKALDKSFIFDGTTLWVVEPANRQVLKHTVVSGTCRPRSRS